MIPTFCKDNTGAELPDSKCPNCGSLVNAGTSPDGDMSKRPGPGDISICSKCAVVLVFTDLMLVRELTPEQVNALPDDVKEEIKQSTLALKNGWEPPPPTYDEKIHP